MGMPIITPTGTITREEAIGNIISSVAMEETALSHILNAESEKLMAVINNPAATPEELFKINCSVKNTISSISRLETLLQAKLSILKAVICEK